MDTDDQIAARHVDAVTYSRVSLEFRAAWIAENPALFLQKYWGFFDEHKGWLITSRASKSSIELTATPQDAA